MDCYSQFVLAPGQYKLFLDNPSVPLNPGTGQAVIQTYNFQYCSEKLAFQFFGFIDRLKQGSSYKDRYGRYRKIYGNIF